MLQKSKLFSILLACITCLLFVLMLTQAKPLYAQQPGAQGLAKQGFNALDPLQNSKIKNQFLNANGSISPGKVISRVLLFAFPMAGLILFVMLIWGGFEMLTGATDTKSQDAGKQRITAAIIGFVLLFISYWLARILEAVFGVNIV